MNLQRTKIDDLKLIADKIKVPYEDKVIRKDLLDLINIKFKSNPELEELFKVKKEDIETPEGVKTYVVSVRSGAQYRDVSGTVRFAKFGEEIQTDKLAKGTYGFREVQVSNLEAAPSINAD